MDTIYMIVTRDKYRLPLYWGSSIRELAERAHMNYRTVHRGVRPRRRVFRRDQGAPGR